jgi:hypothetical protein
VARGDPVDGIGVVRDADAACSVQLVTKAYRPGTGDRGGLGQLGEPLGEHLGAHHGRLPERRAVGVVEGDEHLTAVAVEDREPLSGRARGGDPGAEGVKRRNPAPRFAKAGSQPLGGGDPDPQAGEGARPEPDRDQVDGRPAARRLGAALDLGQQAGGMAGPAPLGEAELGLGQDLAVAPGAGGRVGGRGVEADDDQDGLLRS